MKALYAQHLITVNHYMPYKSFHTFSKANRRQEIQDQNYMLCFSQNSVIYLFCCGS